jgi:TonB family protein
MYFDFDDYRPDITPVGRAISWREGVLLSIIVHLAGVIVLLAFPEILTKGFNPVAVVPVAEQQAKREPTTFVFVQPKLDTPAPKPPVRGEASDQDRIARAPQRAPKPTNTMPFSRGNTPERVEDQASRARGQGPTPEPAAGQPQAQNAPAQTPPQETPALPESRSGLQFSGAQSQVAANGFGGRSVTPGGGLGDALRNLQRFTQNFDNAQGGGGQFGPEIQFDTKGVEFGPWIRRFIAQIKRNWNIPYAVMALKGHVVIQFNVHKDGSITDLVVAGPCPVDAFNNAAFGALSGSNPTQPLPPEYPSEKAFFTVTFFYNESPQ